MSQWAQVTKFLRGEAQQRLENCYQQLNLPLEVRHYCAQHIEMLQSSHMNVGEESACREWIQKLIEKLHHQISELSNSAMHDGGQGFVLKMRLQQTADNLSQNTDPCKLVSMLWQMLEEEKKLIQEANGGVPFQHSEQHEQIDRLLLTTVQGTQQAEEDLRKLHCIQENIVIQYQESQNKKNYIQQLKTNQPLAASAHEIQRIETDKQVIDNSINQKCSEIRQGIAALAARIERNVEDMRNVLQMVLEGELVNWKRSQQLKGNGVQHDDKFVETIQKWCVGLAEYIWVTRQQIRKVDDLQQKLWGSNKNAVIDMSPLSGKVTQLLTTLVTSTFIIEQQPPQVLKTNTRFGATVRLLVGGPLNVHMTLPKVDAIIISEPQANALLRAQDPAAGGGRAQQSTRT